VTDSPCDLRAVARFNRSFCRSFGLTSIAFENASAAWSKRSLLDRSSPYAQVQRNPLSAIHPQA
jgi:hypothetical protein